METRGRTNTQARAKPCGCWNTHRSNKATGITAGFKVKTQCKRVHDNGKKRWMMLHDRNTRTYDNRWAAEAFVEAKNEKEASQ